MNFNSIIRTMVVASVGAWALAGCATQDTASAPSNQAASQASHRQLGFVVLVDGTLGVVDMLNFQKVNTVKVGNYGVHQAAVLPDNRTVYTGNRNDNTIVKLVFSEDGKSYTQKVLGKSPVNLHLFASSPDGAFVVLTSRMELSDEEQVMFPHSGLPDDSIAIIDTKTDKIIKTIALQSPAMAAFPTDGKRLYINNVHHNSVSVIDTATWTEVSRWTVDDKAAAAGHRVSPDGLDVSPDGKWVATADYDSASVTVWETANPANKRKITYGAEQGLPHDVRFAPDSSEMWVTDYNRHPVPADEVGNNQIATHIRVFKTDSLTETRKIASPRKVQRISLPQYSKVAFLTTGIGGIVMLDRETGSMEGEVVIGGLGNPVVCGMTSY